MYRKLLSEFIPPDDHLTLHRPEQMKKLRSVCRAKKVVWRELPNGSHNDTVAEPGYFDLFIDFFNDIMGCSEKL